MKFLLAVLVAGLLSACSLGAVSPSEVPIASIGPSESIAPSDGAGMSDEASPSASEGMTGAACADAWQAVDLTAVQSTSDLDAVASQMEQTFQDCSTLHDWLDQANAALPMLDTTALETWASLQCAQNSMLEQSPVCQEVNG